ncbi:MAG TPA: VCBS repeat-containing protein [Parafilimonas sp.]|nr:VCBS repeat-containing protein [Parafilimonas sp.]
MKFILPLPFLSSLVFLFSCRSDSKQLLFTLEQNTGIDFNNKVVDGNIENSFLFRNFYNGGGVAVGDLNNDGLPDVFLTSNMGDNKLYLNKGNFKFEDITANSGIKQDSMWSTGVEFVDINHDGWLDIYVCNSGHMKNGNRRNKLYINNKNLTLTEESAKYGLDISAYTTQVSFFDYDLDGDLDCFMINNSPMPVNNLGYDNRRSLPQEQWQVASFLKGGGDHLYRNDNGHFREVTQEAGIHGSLISFGLGVSVGDINGDGFADIYVANDSYERDYLYINQKNGTFKDEFETCIAHTSFSSMGADIADINNDGYPEIFTTDMLPGDDFRLKTLGAFDNIDVFRKKVNQGLYYQYMKNCLQLNNGDGTFSEIANYSGVSATDWSWGALMFDADNDGLNDIYVCNGVNRDVTNLDFMDFFANEVIQKMILTGKKDNVDEVLKQIPVNPMINKCFKNEGNLKFKDVGLDWGFTKPSFSNGAAYADLDNDGDLDLVINNENQPAFIYKNNSREINHNHSISFLLKGDSLNTFAVGSTIKIYAGKHIFSRELIPARGFQSSVDYKQLIGLGNISKIDSAVVIWPDHSFNKYTSLKIDSFYTIHKAANRNFYPFAGVQTMKPLFDSVKNNFDKHEEDDYVDFYYERNIPEMLSREGPRAAVGDVNGDHLDDVYIGGTKDHVGCLYIQQADGSFTKKVEPAFAPFLDFEDEAVLFFDADKDGDLDLFVGPGGNDNPPYSREMQNRFFKNDGKGNFALDADAFPSNGMNTGAVAAYDFNHDGYTDLFVGGRSDPRNYGGDPASYMYLNDGYGHFKDIAKTKNPDLAKIGMVTGAVWADVKGDSSKELIISGEWMSPKIFSYNGDHFVEVQTNIKNLNGLWKTVVATDVNNDGKTDLIFGNIGENFYLQPDEKKPVKLWLNDFNQNGNYDKVLTRTVDGQDMPVFLKHDMQDEIPSIKKQNLQHYDYAKKSIQQLFSAELLKGAVVKTFNYCSSVVALNEGDGKFRIQKLPVSAQLSNVNSICVTDINQDGFPDLVIGGNEENFPPQFGRLDAGFGDVLINNGKGNFISVDSKQSGIKVPGMIKDVCAVHGSNETYLLFLRNNNFPMLYRAHNFFQKNLNQ